MFKAYGYFLSFRCPFFVSGLCERPNCHFRHEKPRDDGGEDHGRPSSPISNVEATARAIRRLEAADSSAYTKPSCAVPLYKPTPKSKALSHASVSGIPEYTPTPKKELQKRRHKGGDLEYDPVSNFSCSSGSKSGPAEEVKYVPTSKTGDPSSNSSIQIPKFCTSTDGAGDVEDEDSLDCGDDHANFSDDESNIVGTKDNGDLQADGSALVKSPTKTTDQNGLQTVSTGDVSGDNSGVTVDHHDAIPDASGGSLESKDSAKETEKQEKPASKSSSGKHSKTGKSNSSSSSSHKQKLSSSSKHSSSNKSSSGSSSKHHSSSKSSSSSGKSSSHHSSSSSKKSSSKQSHVGKSNSASVSHHHSKGTDKQAVKHSSPSTGVSEGEPVAKKSKCSDSSDMSKSSGHKSSHSKNSSSSSSRKHLSGSKRSHNSDSDSSSAHKHRRDSEQAGTSGKHKSNNGASHSGKSATRKEKSPAKAGVLQRKGSLVNKELFGEDSDSGEEAVPSEPCGKVEGLTEEEMKQFLEDSDFTENDPFDECYLIFKTCPGTPASAAAKKQLEELNESESEAGKKRVAHRLSDKILRRPKEKPRRVINPAQVMMNRYKSLQQAALAAGRETAAVSKPSPLPSTSALPAPSTGTATPGMKRIASTPSTSKTLAMTADKNQKRTAHVPTQKNLKRPVIPAEYGSKVPTTIRQRYLDIIINECIKICKSEEEAFERALEEESAIYKRSSTKTVYLNVAVNSIKRLRQEGDMGGGMSPTKSVNGSQFSHAVILGGSRAVRTTFTIKRSGSKVLPDVFRGNEFFRRLQVHILTEQQLRDNGYPRPSEDGKPGEAKFYVEISRNASSTNASTFNTRDEKICLRCGRRFMIFPNGNYARREECVYHWGKAWKKRVAGQIESRYTCCGGDLGASGCSMGKLHVHETNKLENLKGYMTTMPGSPSPDGNYEVFALDCEMVYTMAGLELARVTVIDDKCDVVYESLVKPDTDVIDYNTRFSGLTEKDLEGVSTSLREVQAVLLQMFSDKTILIGHSLESDLMALRMIHSTVVDTSVVFPHRAGPPLKRALKNLVSEHLQKIIQNDVGGHDSKEDAVSCLELMQWRIKEDAKMEFGIK